MSWYWTVDGIDVLDEPALMELLAVREHVVGKRDADRAADVARHVDQGRGLVGLVGRNAVIGGRQDRDEDQRQADAEQHARQREEPEVDFAV